MDETLVPVKLPGFVRDENAFLSNADTDRVSVRYFRRKEDGRLVGKIRFGRRCEGPPESVHGGAISAVLDEAMGASTWINGHTVLGVKLSVKFRRQVPMESEVCVEAWVEKSGGKMLRTRALMLGADGTTLAEGEGMFFIVNPKDVSEKLGRGPDFVEMEPEDGVQGQ